MKLVKVLFLMAMMAGSASAAPKWLTAVPRSIGRGYGNMVTFKHPGLALEQWATLGAVIFDQKTTLDAFHRNPRATEDTSYSLFHHGRYGVSQSLLNVALAQTFYVSTEQYAYELLKDDPNKHWRAMRFADSIIPITVHLDAAISNMSHPEEK